MAEGRWRPDQLRRECRELSFQLRRYKLADFQECALAFPGRIFYGSLTIQWSGADYRILGHAFSCGHVEAAVAAIIAAPGFLLCDRACLFVRGGGARAIFVTFCLNCVAFSLAGNFGASQPEKACPFSSQQPFKGIPIQKPMSGKFPAFCVRDTIPRFPSAKKVVRIYGSIGLPGRIVKNNKIIFSFSAGAGLNLFPGFSLRRFNCRDGLSPRRISSLMCRQCAGWS